MTDLDKLEALAKAVQEVCDLLENLAGADEVTDAVYVLFNGQLRHWRDAMNDAADLLQDSARRDAEEIKEARYLLGHVNASTSRAHDPEYIRAGYKYQTHPLSNATYERIKAYFARAAHTGEG